jgi:hypothetical protein
LEKRLTYHDGFTRLDGLPVEIIDSIVALLTLSDICSLRLTGRGVNAKSSQGIFKSHFYNKTVTMSASEQLKHHTLVGLPEPRNQEDANMLLGQSMKNLHLGLSSACLPSVRLLWFKMESSLKRAGG